MQHVYVRCCQFMESGWMVHRNSLSLQLFFKSQIIQNTKLTFKKWIGNTLQLIWIFCWTVTEQPCQMKNIWHMGSCNHPHLCIHIFSFKNYNYFPTIIKTPYRKFGRYIKLKGEKKSRHDLATDKHPPRAFWSISSPFFGLGIRYM